MHGRIRMMSGRSVAQCTHAAEGEHTVTHAGVGVRASRARMRITLANATHSSNKRHATCRYHRSRMPEIGAQVTERVCHSARIHSLRLCSLLRRALLCD